MLGNECSPLFVFLVATRIWLNRGKTIYSIQENCDQYTLTNPSIINVIHFKFQLLKLSSVND